MLVVIAIVNDGTALLARQATYVVFGVLIGVSGPS